MGEQAMQRKNMKLKSQRKPSRDTDFNVAQESNPNTIKKIRSAKQLFTDDWLQSMDSHIKAMEENELDKPEHVFSKAARSRTAYFCLAYIALNALPAKEYADVMFEAERTCRKFGFTFFPDGITISKCQTNTHQECPGQYVSKLIDLKITCKCSCHK